MTERGRKQRNGVSPHKGRLPRPLLPLPHTNKKVALALHLRQETPMMRAWIAQQLVMGSASYISLLTAKEKDCRL
jgi:hypothetical protein